MTQAQGACINSMSAAPWAVEHSTKLIAHPATAHQGFVIPVCNSGGREGDSERALARAQRRRMMNIERERRDQNSPRGHELIEVLPRVRFLSFGLEDLVEVAQQSRWLLFKQILDSFFCGVEPAVRPRHGVDAP